MRNLASTAAAIAAAVLAAAVFALAWGSPNQDVDSDPAIALLASQALLDHGTLRLDGYAGDPACAYDLKTDRRVRRQGGSYAYYNVGVPLLSVPAVWVANRFGFHMLDQGAETALQNLLSALCCALITFFVFLVCRSLVGAASSLAITAVSVLGSSLISTLATALWSTVYAVLLLAAAMLHLTRRRAAGKPPSWTLLILPAAAAFACRPTAGFAVAAGALTLVAAPARSKLLWAAAAGAAAVLALVAAGALPEGLYYTPRKLIPRTPPWIGIYGTLASPSRGLLVFSPFLVAVAAAAIRCSRDLWRQRLFRFAVVWLGLHLTAVSLRGPWWGGHSYGPRLLTEMMLPAVLVTCLAWRRLAEDGLRTARVFAAAYAVLGAVAIWVHVDQGLFNPWVRRWNSSPEIDANQHLLFDWRTPQFLASEASIAARLEDAERRHLLGYRLGDRIVPASDQALWRGWYEAEGTPPEAAWRWTRGTSAAIVLRLGELGETGLYLLELDAGAHRRQAVTVTVAGSAVGRFLHQGFAPRRRVFVVPGELLRSGAENAVGFEVPGAAAAADDPRLLGLALRSLELRPSPEPFAVGYADDAFFESGFSEAESGWRWTDGHRAAVLYPLADVEAGAAAALELLAGCLGEQRVELSIGGAMAGELVLRGQAPTLHRVPFDAALLRPWSMNRFEFALPDAHRPAGDARVLGLAFVRLEVRVGTRDGIR